MSFKYKIGEHVRVTDNGEIYSSYTEMFEEMDFAYLKGDHYVDKGTEGIIFNRKIHPSDGNSLYGIITKDGKQFLINEKGLKPTGYYQVPLAKRVKLGSYIAVISKEGINVGCQIITPQQLTDIVQAAKEVGMI